MNPVPVELLMPGQLYWNTEEEQHAVVLGHNGIGWVFQYEDGDVAEFLAQKSEPVSRNLGDQMVYKPSAREIEKKRPTFSGACPADEHIFLGDPLTTHERTNSSVRCGRCGLEYEALADDLAQFPEVHRQIPTKCEHCSSTIPSGRRTRTPLVDFHTCADCAETLSDITTWSEYKEKYT